jgi:DNA (cytosine-5)-methyltransferase 1
MLKVLDLFSGIGGFSLGLERTGGFETVAFCEIEKFPQKVLAKHWPGVPIYEDVKELTAERLAADGITGISVITGGFPCQDLSIAGKQSGINAERSGLWTELARLIGELRPQYAIVENVTALLSGESGRWFQRVLGDLAEIRYDCEWHCIPASSVGAIHDRDRVWVIAYPNKIGSRNGFNYIRRNKLLYGLERFTEKSEPKWERVLGGIRENFQTRNWELLKARVRGMDDGLPSEMDRARCSGLGNAVVPQIPELIGRAILEAAHDSQG